MINPQWLQLPMSRTIFYGPKDVRAIEVRLYVLVLIRLGIVHLTVGFMGVVVAAGEKRFSFCTVICFYHYPPPFFPVINFLFCPFSPVL